MTDKEAIKYLQQLYPNGGHCWLDEQRIEAIRMAVKALQEEPQVKKLAESQHEDKTCKENENSLTQEPVNKDFEMALTEMIDKAQKCVVEPWAIAAQWKDYLIELAKSEEPVSGEWIEELTTKLDSISKEDFKKVFDKYAIDFNEEPVSEDLEKASSRFACKCHPLKTECSTSIPNREVIEAFKAGAKWQKEQFEKDYTNLCNGIATAKGLAVAMAYNKGVADTKEQMMAKAIDATVHIEAGNYPYIPQMELYDYDKDVPLAKEGDKYKVVLIKEK